MPLSSFENSDVYTFRKATSAITSSDSIDDRLYAHVLGDGSPCGALLSDGAFPPDWVDQYLTLLDAVSNSFAGADLIPRRVAWAIHFASWYLPMRYNVWCTSTGLANNDTVRQLARLRTPSELFFGTDGSDPVA